MLFGLYFPKMKKKSFYLIKYIIEPHSDYESRVMRGHFMNVY